MATPMARTVPTKHDPDRLVALEEELDVQLRSLDDLEAEYEAGDLDEDDYQTLKDDYTVRVADTMRRLEDQRAAVPTATGRRFNPLAIGLVALFAVVAGWLLARSTGERGVGDILTGDISTPRQRILDCQETAGQGQIAEALECLDGVLVQEPENPQALTYRGWYLLLATGSVAAEAGSEGEAQAAEMLATGLTYLDRAVESDPGYPDARAFRAVAYDRLGRSEDVCAELAALLSLDPPPFFIEQTAVIAVSNNCV
jgi:tetratricopeptide (TPR) repeat protein